MSTYDNIKGQQEFNIPDGWKEFNTIDMHTGGEPLRVILSGYPKLEGNSVLDCRNYCIQNLDAYRTALMFEPRGHADMYGCLLVPPNDDTADFGILFLHNEGYSTMCGHAIIAIAKLTCLMGWIDVVEGENIIKIDAPCGRITAFVDIKNEEVEGVRFHCVPSFVVGLDRKVNVEGLGEVVYDLAYGGAFYAYVDLNKNKFDFNLDKKHYLTLIQKGMDIKHAVMHSVKDIVHPFEEDLSFLYGTIFISDSKNVDSKNVCVFAEGEVDRCPTGSGVSGRMAIHRKRNEINIGESMEIESITGSIFKGSVIEDTTFGDYNAVIPQVEGTAYITGIHNFVIDPKDPMGKGFIFR